MPKSIRNPNGVPACLNFVPQGETIGKSCATCDIRDGLVSMENGKVVEVWCTKRKMHNAPVLKPADPVAVDTVEGLAVES